MCCECGDSDGYRCWHKNTWHNPYFLGEVYLYVDADTKKAWNKILQKTASTLTTYAQVLKDFVDFVKSWNLFLTPPNEGLQFAPT
jgi:hypothetical protein